MSLPIMNLIYQFRYVHRPFVLKFEFSIDYSCEIQVYNKNFNLKYKIVWTLINFSKNTQRITEKFAKRDKTQMTYSV